MFQKTSLYIILPGKGNGFKFCEIFFGDLSGGVGDGVVYTKMLVYGNRLWYYNRLQRIREKETGPGMRSYEIQNGRLR